MKPELRRTFLPNYGKIQFCEMKGIVFVNVTPHGLMFEDPKNGTIWELPPSGILIHAVKKEDVVSDYNGISFVKVRFEESPEDRMKLDKLIATFRNYDRTIIIGSSIASTAYKEIVSVTADPKFDRYPLLKKRFNPTKFVVKKELG